MIRIIALILTIIGMVALVFGVLGLFGDPIVSLNPWSLTILGGIFFIAGISMFKYSKGSSKA